MGIIKVDYISIEGMFQQIMTGRLHADSAEGQTSTIVPPGESRLNIDFLDNKSQAPEDVSIWFVKIQTKDGWHDAVLKVFHEIVHEDEKVSLASAKNLSTKIWRIWDMCRKSGVESSVLSAKETAVIEMNGSDLNLKWDHQREGDDHELKGRRVAGVLMQRLGVPLANADFKDYTGLSEANVLLLLTTIGKVLDAFQHEGLVHCDIKEQNIVYGIASTCL